MRVPILKSVKYSYNSRYAGKDIPYRNTIEHTDWSSSVKKRDKHRCVICGINDKVHAHHLLSYSNNSEKRYDIKNGVTLCVFHHRKFHKIYGVIDFDETDFDEFYNIERNSVLRVTSY